MLSFEEVIGSLDPCRTDMSALARADVGAPAFGEPWHAQVFGLAMAMAQTGAFSWAEWVDTFSKEIRANPQSAGETSEEAYYRQWSEALIQILARVGALDDAEIADAAEHWRRSYLATEHGLPIHFRRDLPDMVEPDHDHHHHHHHDDHAAPPTPVAVSPAA